MSNSSIWPIDRTLSGVTTLSQSEPGSDGNKGLLCIPQMSSITGVSLSDYLISYPWHLSWGVSYPFAEMQSVYSAAPTNRATIFLMRMSLNNPQRLICHKTKKLAAFTYLLIVSFLHQLKLLFFPWTQWDSKSLQVTRTQYSCGTELSILAEQNSVFLWNRTQCSCWNDCSQIVQEDIPCYRVAIHKPKQNKVEIQNISPISSSFLFFLCSLHREEDTSDLRWSKKKPTESDIKTQTKQMHMETLF